MVLQFFSQIFENKSIILLTSIVDLKLRYRSSVLGILWSLIEPLLILTILFIVFSSILKIDIPNFPIFLLLGIILFQLYSRTTLMGMESILSRAGIVSTVNIPRIIFPVSSSLTAFYMMLIEFIVFFGFLVVFQYIPPITILFLPIIILLVYILGVGLAISLSVLNIRYRDVRSIWTVVLQASFFLTPIFYKLDFLPETIRQFIQFSPLAQLVEMAHIVVLENKLPDPFWFAYVVLSVVLIFVISLLLYKELNKNLVEQL